MESPSLLQPTCPKCATVDNFGPQCEVEWTKKIKEGGRGPKRGTVHILVLNLPKTRNHRHFRSSVRGRTPERTNGWAPRGRPPGLPWTRKQKSARRNKFGLTKNKNRPPERPWSGHKNHARGKNNRMRNKTMIPPACFCLLVCLFVSSFVSLFPRAVLVFLALPIVFHIVSFLFHRARTFVSSCSPSRSHMSVQL